MTNARTIREHAEQLAAVLSDIEDKKVEAKAILDAAHEQGLSKSVLRRIAQELIMDSKKLADRLAAEEQLDLFRSAVDLRSRKGIDSARTPEMAG